MQRHLRPALLALALAGACALATQPVLARPETGNSTGGSATTVSGATGTISQLNYNDSGFVDGLVLGSTVVLRFPSRVCAGVASLGSVGQSVTYSGSALTNSVSGLQVVRVSSLSNASAGTSYTAPATPTTSAYAATAGTLTRLNFDAQGAINGFLFTPTASGTPVLVTFGQGLRNTTLAQLLVVGTALTVTGSTVEGETFCSAAAVGTVRAATLTINGSTFTIVGRAN